MRRLILKMQISVDGFIGGPNGEVDWIFKTMDGEATDWIVSNLWEAGVHIMGSRTFRDMAAHWPTSTEPFAPPMNEIPKVVFSRSGNVEITGGETTRALRDATEARKLRGVEAGAGSAANRASWTEARIASGDLAEEIAWLKREPGKDILAHGGARFARSLVRLGLIDEYQLVVHPAVLGGGLALFADLPAPLDLKLVSSQAFPAGAVANVYRVHAK